MPNTRWTKLACMLALLLCASAGSLPDASCDDSPTFLFEGKIGKDCNWIRKKPALRCHWIDPITQQAVLASCPRACGKCPQKRNNGSTSTCVDDDSFRFKNQPKKGCRWVDRKRRSRKKKLCKKTPIRTNCPVTCETCSTSAPTGSSTALPSTASPIKLPTRIPTSFPTTLPTMMPTKRPTTIPTKPPSPSESNACGCSTCTESVLNTYAGPYTCGARIDWLRTTQGYSERDACVKVAGDEFPGECGGCDPNRCSPEPNDDDNNNNNDDDDNPPSESQKCGGAVNSSNDSNQVCRTDLWTPTGDSSMHCFAYGGSGDPCHLNNNNDLNDGLNKDPSLCRGDTLYLWDEPDTQGKSYAWAGEAWFGYSRKFPNQLKTFRARGGKVTSALLTAGGGGVLARRLGEFLSACGSACSDPNDPAYIDVIALNAFCGDFNGASGCAGGARFIYNEASQMSLSNANRPVYITNWSRLGTSDSNQQKGAMDAIGEFFPSANGVVKRVYWFGAKDFGGGSSNNFLTNTFSDGTSLGQYWADKCSTLE